MRQVVLITGSPLILRDSLLQVLSCDPVIEARTEGANGVHPRRARADVVLFVANSEEQLVSGVRDLRAAYPEARLLLLLLTEDDAMARSALRLGVDGLVDCNTAAAELVECIKQLAHEQVVISSQLARRLARENASANDHNGAHSNHLTERELEVLRLLAEGATNRDIATRLSLSEHTVRAHLRVIMQKLQVTNRVQAAARAWHGYLSET